MTKRIALCLLGALLCLALALCALALPARADDTPPADGRINEDFESINSIPKSAPWVLAPSSPNTFFSPIAGGYDLSSMTGIVEDPEADEEAEVKNHALRMGLGGTGESGCQDIFATRSVTDFNRQFTVSYDFYFPSVLKSGDTFALMFFGVGGAGDFGGGASAQPYTIQAVNGKNVLRSTGVFSFDNVELPLNQWFTVTLTVDVESKKADIYWSAENPETGKREYNSVVWQRNLNNTWSTGAAKGLGFMRFGSFSMKYDESNPTVYYIDNIYVQPTYESYISRLPADEAFRLVHAEILAKTESDLAKTDGDKINAAIADYNELDAEAKELLSDEYATLQNLLALYNAEDRWFKLDHATILAKTADDLVRSDYSAINAALTSYDALEQEFKDKVAVEYATLTELSEAYNNKFVPFDLYEDFESYEVGAQLPYAGGAALNVNSEYAYARTNDLQTAGGGICYDPLDNSETNKVYKISGATAAEDVDASKAGEIVSRRNVFRYNDKFTIKTSFFIPQTLKEGESFNFTFSLINTNSETAIWNTTRNPFVIKAQYDDVTVDGETTTVGKNMITIGNYGADGLRFFATELPQDKWFDIVIEAYRDSTGEGLVGIYLEAEGERTVICLSPCRVSQLRNGLAYYTIIPTFATLTDENETPSVIYFDNMFLANGYYLDEEDLTAEISSAKTEARGYLSAIQSYLSTDSGESTQADDQTTDYEAMISGFDNATSLTELHDYLKTFKLEANYNLLGGALNDYAAGLKSANSYSEEGIAAIDKAIADCLDQNSATSIYCKGENNSGGMVLKYAYNNEACVKAVTERYEAALAEMDDVPVSMEEITNAKEAAKAELDGYDPDDYRDAQKTELSEAVSAGKAAIDAATTVEEVNAALAAAKSAIALIKTDAQLSAEEEAAAALQSAKDAAKAELDEYKSADDYRAEQQAELSEAITAGKAAIDAATSEEEVNAALANAKTAIDGIKTAAEYEEEEAAEAALNKAKADAKAELAAYKNAADYRNAEKAELAAEISAGNADIDAATSEKAISTALALAKAKIDLIKTDAQLTAEGVPNEDGKPTEQPDPDENEGKKKGGCGSDLFADSYVWIAFMLLATCAASIAFAAKKQK